MSHRIIEKRRRDRMNNCLADLSRLIPSSYLKKGRGRIEKTEIIEMAIKHMKHLQMHSNCRSIGGWIIIVVQLCGSFNLNEGFRIRHAVHILQCMTLKTNGITVLALYLFFYALCKICRLKIINGYIYLFNPFSVTCAQVKNNRTPFFYLNPCKKKYRCLYNALWKQYFQPDKPCRTVLHTVQICVSAVRDFQVWHLRLYIIHVWLLGSRKKITFFGVIFADVCNVSPV